MSNALLEFHRPGPPLTSTEACRKRSPRGQYIGVNEKGIKQWVETVVGFWVCSPLGARCDLCTDLLLAAVREEILTLLNRIFFFFQLPEATQHKPVVKVIGDLGEGMPKRNNKTRTNPELSNCKNCRGFAVFCSQPGGFFNN